MLIFYPLCVLLQKYACPILKDEVMLSGGVCYDIKYLHMNFKLHTYTAGHLTGGSFKLLSFILGVLVEDTN